MRRDFSSIPSYLVLAQQFTWGEQAISQHLALVDGTNLRQAIDVLDDQKSLWLYIRIVEEIWTVTLTRVWQYLEPSRKAAKRMLAAAG